MQNFTGCRTFWYLVYEEQIGDLILFNSPWLLKLDFEDAKKSFLDLELCIYQIFQVTLINIYSVNTNLFRGVTHSSVNIGQNLNDIREITNGVELLS